MHQEINSEYLASQGLSPTLPERYWAKVRKDGPVPQHMPHLGPCWSWTACRDTNGYGQMHTGFGNVRIRAHVASWILHNGPIPEGLEVMHLCDNPQCSRIDHLQLGTHRQNFEDAANKRRMPHGEKQANSKLTQVQVDDIRKRYVGRSKGKSNAGQLMTEFGISSATLSRIVNRRRWKYS